MLAGVKSVVRFNLYWLEFVIKLTLQLYSLHLINLRQVQKIRSFTLNQEAIIRKHYPAQFMGYQSNEKTELQHSRNVRA